MTGTDRPVGAGPAVPGTTRITARALERLAVCLVRDAAHVDAIAVRLADAGGSLKVTVTVPVAVGAGHTGSIADRSALLRRDVIAGMRDLGGRTVGAVDVRYSGVRRPTERRTR